MGTLLAQDVTDLPATVFDEGAQLAFLAEWNSFRENEAQTFEEPHLLVAGVLG